MPIAPVAIKSLLITSSLVAAGVAAYQTNPDVRNFVDTTKLKAQLALEEFLENLEAEFNPDENARVRLRQRRAARERRAREAMMMGVSVDGGQAGIRQGSNDIVITASGQSHSHELQDLRHRQQTTTTDDDNAADPPEEDIAALASPSSRTTHETLFSQYTSTSNLASAQRTASIEADLVGLTLSPSITATTSGIDDSLDDLNDLDPFADPLAPHTPMHGMTDDTEWYGDDEGEYDDLQQSRHTPTTPSGMSFVTDVDVNVDDPPEEMVLTPVTPRTTSAGEEEASYFEVDGVRARSGSVRTTASKRSEGSSVSGVGFGTPDEDEEDGEVTWGRA
jgi:hypothetical protein